MTCEEVKFSLHDYVDELLDEKTRKEVEVHLRTCPECIFSFKKLKNFFDILQKIPHPAEPPEEIIANLSGELLKRTVSEVSEEKEKPKINLRRIKREQKKQEKELRISRGAGRKSLITRSVAETKLKHSYILSGRLEVRKTILTLLPLVIIAVCYYIYDFTKMNSPWKVRTLLGSVFINGRIDELGRWDEGTSLFLQQYSKAVVSIPSTGRMEVNENSLLILEKAKKGDNAIVMKRGKIQIENTEQMPDLAIQIKNYRIHDHGGAVTLTVDDAENILISVELGYVEIKGEGRILFVDEGYNCELRTGSFTGTPYRSEAPDTLKQLIQLIDYQNGGDAAIQKVIDLASDSDILTLLALIPKASGTYRAALYDKISKTFPPPGTITKEGIINLDQYMFEDWWYEIEWQL
ncbi:MAG: zf-HC2 domain-containing protein [Ignavibacteriales bacterium]|nr:zf-HC2 domain-containing protein [Ignavibacteriales bacterium]